MYLPAFISLIAKKGGGQAAGLQTPQPRRPRIASLPPTANQTVTNQLLRLQSSPATKPPLCPVTKQTRYNLNILPQRDNLQSTAPASIDNPSIRHTVTKQTRHPPCPKTGTRHVPGLYAKHYFMCTSKLSNVTSVKPVLRVYGMQEQHVCRLLDEPSAHISDAIRADGMGNFESALGYYSAGMEKLDAVLWNIPD